MMAPEYYIFTGSEVIPRHITHVLIDKSLKFVPARACYEHPNIEEVRCHDGVEKIGKDAFHNCPRLQRAIMPGVKEVERGAFASCKALTYIECGKLERIGEVAFGRCKSLSSIDLPFIKIVEKMAFSGCWILKNAKLGKELESIGMGAFLTCSSLECITLPLKDGVFADDTIFQQCDNLHNVDLIGEVKETIDALLIEEWKNDMNQEIHTISQILPNTPAGSLLVVGETARTIRAWIRRLLRKYTHYKAEHRRFVNVAATALKPALPNDILFKSVLPFVELPAETFNTK